MSVLEGASLIDEYIPYAGGTRSIGELAKIRRAVVTFAPEVLVYLAPPRGILATRRDHLFFRGCGIKRFIGLTLTRDSQMCRPPLPGKVLYKLEASRLARSIECLGHIDLANAKNWDLHLTSAEIEEATRIINEGMPHNQGRTALLGLSIGTKQEIKDWGDNNWRAVLKGLDEVNLGLVLIGAAEERGRSQKFADAWHGPTLNLCGRISPRVSAAVIQKMALFLCHDSGPMHLAASVGTRCVAVFSRLAPPGKWYPFGKNHKILYPKLPTDTNSID